MKNIFSRISFVSVLAVAISGCATGPKISESGAFKQSVPNGKAQIIVYRDQLLGVAIQPAVNFNGQEVGRCIPNGAFNLFVSPGSHELSATTETTTTIRINAIANRTAYVKCSISFGVFVGRPSWELMPPNIGASEIQSLSFTGGAQGR